MRNRRREANRPVFRAHLPGETRPMRRLRLAGSTLLALALTLATAAVALAEGTQPPFPT